MAEAIVISNEDDLWRLLGRFTATKALAIEPELFQFAGWRPQLLYFPDEKIGHSISPSIAKAISGFHSNLSRAYAYLAYGEANARRLQAVDEGILDIRILVVDGSDGFEIIEEALDRLVKGLVGKMSGRQITIAVIAFLLLFFGSSAAKQWMDEEYKAKQHDTESSERLRMSAEETKRMELLTTALAANPNIKPVAEIAGDSREPLVRAATTTDRTRVMGTEITRDEAKVIISKKKHKGEGKRIDGVFEVVEIDIENEDGYMGTLRNVKTQEEYKVQINRSELTEEDIHVLFDALENKSSVDALVNAWFVGDKVSYAAVIRANKVAHKKG